MSGPNSPTDGMGGGGGSVQRTRGQPVDMSQDQRQVTIRLILPHVAPTVAQTRVWSSPEERARLLDVSSRLDTPTVTALTQDRQWRQLIDLASRGTQQQFNDYIQSLTIPQREGVRPVLTQEEAHAIIESNTYTQLRQAVEHGEGRQLNDATQTALLRGEHATAELARIAAIEDRMKIERVGVDFGDICL